MKKALKRRGLQLTLTANPEKDLRESIDDKLLMVLREEDLVTEYTPDKVLMNVVIGAISPAALKREIRDALEMEDIDSLSKDEWVKKMWNFQGVFLILT